jgi:phage repressor protein C with HTH and peptisase S24 domain
MAKKRGNPVERWPGADELERRMKAVGIAPKPLSALAKVNETYVRDVLGGNSLNPRMDHMQRVIRALEKLERTHHIQRIDLDESVNQTLPLATPVKEIDVYVGMGGGGLMDEENVGDTWQFPTDWLKSEIRGSDLGRLYILTLEGDSMAGTLEPGDKVIVDTARLAPSPPGLFIVHDGISLVAKRLEYISGTEPPRVRVISDNRHYPVEEHALNEIHIRGRIMGRWQRLS